MSNTVNLREQAINEAVAEYLEAERLGRPIGALTWLAKHADVRDELERFLGDRSLFARAAGPVEAPTLGLEESSSAASLPTVRYFGDYELLEEVARGGMGVVYKARQVSLNRVVALKMILRGSLAAKEDVQRFRTEAEAAANLDHPNIVPIYEVGDHEGHQYFTMKFIDGVSLSERLRGDGERDVSKLVCDVVIPVARAVQFAHQRGILHRDLKPGNILLDADGTPYVADFGLARRLDADSNVTRTGQVIGSPSYMSPEQARGDKVLTTAADVYSLGAILYELIAGRPPFRGANVVETLKQVVEDEPTNPSKFNVRADQDLATIALHCLEKDPAKRYGSAEQVAEEIARWQRGEAIVARPVGSLEKSWKWAKRRPAVAALLTGVAMLMVIGMLTMAGMLRYANMFARETERRAAAESGRWEEEKAAAARERELKDEAVAARKEAELRRDEATRDRAVALEREQAARSSWYSADISLAARAWDAGSTPRVRQLLNQHRPKPGERDLRGFEWQYLWRAMQAAKETKQLGNGEEASWRLLANGRYAARCGDKSARIEIWEVATAQRREIPGQFVLVERRTQDVADQWTVFTGEMTFAEPKATDAAGKPKARSGELIIRTVDLKSGGEVAAERKVAFHTRPEDFVGNSKGSAFALAADGRTLVEVATVSNLPEKSPAEPLGVFSMLAKPFYQIRTRFTVPDSVELNEFLASGMWVTMPNARESFSPLAVRGDGGSVALVATEMPRSGLEAALRQWAPVSSGMKTAIFRFDQTKGFTGTWSVSKSIAAVYGVTFSPDGKELIVAENDHVLRIRDAQSGLEKAQLHGHTGAIRCIAFSADDKFMATAGEDLTIRVWDRKTHVAAGVFPGHLEPINGVAFSIDGTALISVDRRGTVKRWDAANPPGPRSYIVASLSPTSVPGHVAFVDNESKLLIDRPDMRRNAAESKTVIELATGRRLTESQLPKGSVAATVQHGSQPWVLLADVRGTTSFSRLWNTATNEVKEVPPIQGYFFFRRTLSTDGRYLAGVVYDREGTFTFVRKTDGTVVHELTRGKDAPAAVCFEFSADGRQVYVLSKQLGFSTWDSETGTAGLSVPLTVVPTGRACLSGDGTGIYFATEDRQICRCDVKTGNVTVVTTGAIDRPVQILSSPDDQRLFVLSGVEGSPASIVIWDLQSGRELMMLPVPAASVRRIILSPDGTKLAADTPDAVIVWDATPLSR